MRITGDWIVDARRAALRNVRGSMTREQWRRLDAAWRAMVKSPERLMVRGCMALLADGGMVRYGRALPICGPLGVLP